MEKIGVFDLKSRIFRYFYNGFSDFTRYDEAPGLNGPAELFIWDLTKSTEEIEEIKDLWLFTQTTNRLDKSYHGYDNYRDCLRHIKININSREI